jgi:hypothetical protein
MAARLIERIRRAWAQLVAVNPIEPGRANDGLTGAGVGMLEMTAGTALDPTWYDLSQQFTDTLDVWRKNPLARRFVNLITCYVISDGVQLATKYKPLAKFLTEFTHDPLNLFDLAQTTWCDTLTRDGELFLSLHLNIADGMSYVRALPALVFDKVQTRPGDYTVELSYHETVPMGDPDYAAGGRTWLSPEHPDADNPNPDGSYPAVVLHFAVNRPVGCVRGESDLAPVLAWLRRYNRWLEDRVRLNAAIRAFLWMVTVPTGQVTATATKYRTPPEPGTVVVKAETETWEAVTPSIEAGDAQADGRAIRWMIVAGGPGIGLADLGEAEGANLATAAAMGEQRQRFMRGRQGYFGFLLAQTAITAYNRAVRLGLRRGLPKTLSDIAVALPDIAPEDNKALADAGVKLATALEKVNAQGLRGPTWQKMVLRLVLEFAGEQLDEKEIEQILAESAGVVDGTPGQSAPLGQPVGSGARMGTDGAWGSRVPTAGGNGS